VIAAVRTGDVVQAAELSSLHVDLTTQVLEDARHLFDSD